MSNLHADASPSSSEIWMACPASVTKARGRQRLPTPYTREGTAAHRIAEGMLGAIGSTKRYKPPQSLVVDGEKVEVTAEMLDAVDTYVSYVKTLIKRGYTSIETKVTIPHRGELIFGTSDCFNVREADFEVEIVDFKYGQGVPVHPSKPQTKLYALGVLDHIGPFADIRTVKITIVQPRVDPDNPINSIVIPVEDLINWEKVSLTPALDRLAAGDMTETPGDHCRWCVRAGECHALAALAQANAQVAFGDVPPDPSGMSNDELGAVLEHATMVVSWLRKVQAEASQRIDHGQCVPGWKLVPTRASRKWEDGDGAIRELVKRGADPLEITRIETIGTVEKVMKRRRIPATVIDEFTIKKSSGSTLVSEKDDRPAIDNRADMVFDALTDQ